MTQPYLQYPQQPNAPVVTKQRKVPLWTWIVLASSVLVAGAIVAAALIFSGAEDGGSNEPSNALANPTTTTATAPVEDTAEPEADPVPFTVNDFKLRVKILSEECFGSAGCSVEFRVLPTYVGSGTYEDRTVEITCKVTGLSDAQTNTFELTNGEYDQYDVEGYGDIPSSNTKLKAKIISVTE